jgi:6-phosphofructokinase 1
MTATLTPAGTTSGAPDAVRTIAVLTSGGDAPGMNAAIRSVVRNAEANGIDVLGVRHGYAGLMDGDIVPLDRAAVDSTFHRGGTLLGSDRAPEFKSEAGQLRGLEQLARREVDGLVVIGGNGSQSGAAALWRRGFPVVGLASTIDNDLTGFDTTLGVDTALNTILDAVERIRDTAMSHRRAFVVEVMGRDSGYLGMQVALAIGADLAILPEAPAELATIQATARQATERGQTHLLIVLAEGANWTPETVCEAIETAEVGFDSRPLVIGHLQRGGAPTMADRVLGARLGAAAVQALANREAGFVVGVRQGTIAHVPFGEAIHHASKVDAESLALVGRLAGNVGEPARFLA